MLGTVLAAAIVRDSTSDPDTQQEDHDPDGRRRHEQEHELLPGELDLVEAVVRVVVCEFGHAYALGFSRFSSSIGSGKMIVEFFSDAISVRVWR